MRVFIQDDERSDVQFVEFGQETRKTVINVVSTLFGDKYCSDGTVGNISHAFEVLNVHGDDTRKMLVVSNTALESLIDSLELLDIEIIFVKCSCGMTAEFDEILNHRYSYVWEWE